MDPVLSIKNLKTYFYTHQGIVKACDDVSFSINQGEVLGIVGESGSGKTVTTLSIVKLLPMPPAKIVSGEIYFEGNDIIKKSPESLRKIRGSKISLIFQDPMTSLNPFLTIERQMTEILVLHKKLSRKEAIKQVIEYLNIIGIPEASKRIYDYPHQFSGGMRQRVMIAMGISTNPTLLIADEPTTALDVTIQAQILEILKDLQKKFKTSIILITHNLGVVANMAHNIIVMYAGHIMEYATTEELFLNPKHPYTQGLLKSIPKLNVAEKSQLFTIEGLPPDLINIPEGCPFRNRCLYAHDKCKKYPEKKTAIKDAKEHSYYCWL
jgi:oligopeptide transport system ATP-binding protein